MAGLAQYLPDVKTLAHHDGKEVAVESLAGKTVFFYFSASWCPPCRGFTPQLAAFYNAKREEKNFEVVWISWDEEKDDYTGYFEKMPWLAVPFENAEITKALTKTFSVESIPTLIGVDGSTGKVITTTARAELVKDPDGQNFPWSS